MPEEPDQLEDLIKSVMQKQLDKMAAMFEENAANIADSVEAALAGNEGATSTIKMTIGGLKLKFEGSDRENMTLESNFNSSYSEKHVLSTESSHGELSANQLKLDLDGDAE
tara:strand:+ start:70 stop:402 length:333 start_codon:yes stop_codon:yes gene_type:complete